MTLIFSAHALDDPAATLALLEYLCRRRTQLLSLAKCVGKLSLRELNQLGLVPVIHQLNSDSHVGSTPFESSRNRELKERNPKLALPISLLVEK